MKREEKLKTELNYHDIQDLIGKLIEKVEDRGVKIKKFRTSPKTEITKKNLIGLKINNYKDIVLESEMGLELGGMNVNSFSLIYPMPAPKGIKRIDKLYLIGSEIAEIDSKKLDFSLFILLTVNDLDDSSYENLRNLTFLSDGIEGFTIRSIPRRFWCRISQNTIEKGFSFKFFGDAIISLYRERFGAILKTLEIIMINSHSDLIDKWLEYTVELRENLNARWREKVDDWKKRIDCDYEWACKICPYFKSCQTLQHVLERRKNLEMF